MRVQPAIVEVVEVAEVAEVVEAVEVVEALEAMLQAPPTSPPRGRRAARLPHSFRRAAMAIPSELTIEPLLPTATVEVRDIYCRGSCRHMIAEECASGVHLGFPYRGVYVRHVGAEQVVAEANQVVLFNPDKVSG